ncbi:MAG TPA: tryptophan synthase subunit alpha [Solirubrobacteraceae bacterium]|jgi:tryptophan synthase alpha chain|nr:tryptophan synthase subunit alpha [Solirubrobacteraceae bacterium]
MNAGHERIAAAFAASGKHAALMPYLMGGFPDLATSRRIGEACIAAGADVLELGVPFSDPLADGPVIHAAGTAALAAGCTLTGVLEVGRALAETVPVVLMCYASLVLARGEWTFAELLGRTGISGLIVPDMPLEESDAVFAACEEHGVALVPLVAPTTTEERMARIGARARGFVYAVSVVGITGERATFSDRVAPILARARAHSTVPVAVGFGISTGEHAAQAAASGAQGVIVGTRLVRAAGEATDPPGAVRELVGDLSAALARPNQ